MNHLPATKPYKETYDQTKKNQSILAKIFQDDMHKKCADFSKSRCKCLSDVNM